MDTIEYTLERFSEEHLEAVRKLFFDTYSVHRPGFPERKYDLKNQQHSFSYVMIIAGKVVGFYGIQLIRYQKEGEEIVIPQGCDLLMDPDYRSKGLFGKLYNEVELRLIQEGFACTIGYQNDASYAFCRKMNWLNDERLRRFHFRTGPRNLARAVRLSGLENWKRKHIARRLEKYLVMTDWSTVNQLPDRYNAVRDAAFMKTKYVGDHYAIRLEGCTLILCYKRYMEVGALELEKEADVRKMLHCLQRIMRSCLVHEVVFQLRPDTKEAETLKSYLDSHPSFYIGYKELAPGGTELFHQLNIRMLDADIF